MRKTVRNIGNVILIYIVSMVFLNILSGFILRQYYNGRSYIEIVILLFCNETQIDGQNMIIINLVVALKKLIEGIALAVLASFVFSHILNREVRIVLPDKIALRRRTSEGNEGKLTLGVLIGNPGRRELLDVKCSINCSYVKQVDEIDHRNGEKYLNCEVDSIHNFFRFSFDIYELHKNYWKHYLEKKEDYVNKDVLIVSVTGKTSGLGGYFRVTKMYGLQDIVVDVHEPRKYFEKKVKNIFTSKQHTKIDWKEFSKCIEAGEDERCDIINEIQNYVNEKETKK